MEEYRIEELIKDDNDKKKILKKRGYAVSGDFTTAPFLCVVKDGYCNIVDYYTLALFSPRKWFDDVIFYTNATAAGVEIDGKHNIFNEEHKLISPIWFDGIWSGGYEEFIVKLNEKYNILRMDGSLVSESQWFDYVEYTDKFKHVTSDKPKYKVYFSVDDDNWCYMDEKGHLLDNDENKNSIKLTENTLRKYIKQALKETLNSQEEIKMKKIKR